MALVKESVSSTEDRSHRPTSPSSAARMKASRHPQESSASGERVDVMMAPIPEAMSTPAPTETCCQDPANARRRGAADSTRNAEEEPNSPGGEALDHAGCDQDDRGQDAHLFVSGSEADDRRRTRHHANREDQALLAPVAVGIGSHHRGAYWAHDEADGEDRQRGEQSRYGSPGGKKWWAKIEENVV